MNTAQKKIKNNKKLRIFLAFLFLSLLFWLLIKLSHQYTATTKVTVTYADIPKNKLLQSDVTTTLDVRVKSIGFNIFRNKINKKNIVVGLNKAKRKRGTIYYYLTSQLIPELDEKFSKSNVVSVSPDTLFFDLGKSMSKKLRVIPNVDIQYSVGYNLLGELQVEPKFVTVTGPQSQIDSMLTIHTEKIELTSVNSNFSKELTIVKNSNLKKVRYSEEKIKISGKVEKFTERTIKVDFNIINLPSNYEITTYPKQVELVFQVGLSDFNNILENDFIVECDFEESVKNDFNYLIPKLKSKSNLVKDVKIVPNKIEYLIEK